MRYSVRRFHSPDGDAQIAQPRWRHVNCADGDANLGAQFACEWRMECADGRTQVNNTKPQLGDQLLLLWIEEK